jgi:hypothetical protein
MTDLSTDNDESQSEAPRPWVNDCVELLQLYMNCQCRIKIPSRNLDRLSQAMARFLGLQRLEIIYHHHHQFADPDVRTNHRLSFAGVKLASLREVELNGFSTDSKSLLSLLCSNPGTLSGIDMQYIWLWDFGWARIWDRLSAMRCALDDLGRISNCHYIDVDEFDGELEPQADSVAWNALRSYVEQRRREQGLVQ